MTDDAETYFRVRIYIPLLENVIEDLNFRFNQKVYNSFELAGLVPSEIRKISKNEIEKLVKNTAEYLGPLLEEDKELLLIKLNAEADLWLKKWEKVSERQIPTSAVDAYYQCDRNVYPYINTTLRVLCTLPVSNASSERSFSALKRLKSWLRATMSQQRLVGLALLHIHRDIKISVSNVIDRFSKIKKRRLDFVL